MDSYTNFVIFGGMAVAALAFSALWLTVLRRYASPELPDQKISFVQLLLLGLGGVGGIGSLIAAYLTLTNAFRVEAHRSESEFIQEYLKGMETLITSNKLPEFDTKPEEEDKNRIRRVARAQTLAVLRAVEDPERKRVVMRFLDESDLILKPEPLVDLSDANFVEADLTYVGLGEAKLDHAILSEATLVDASLVETSFYGAYLDGANLKGANLTGADLRWAGLTGANLRDADLTDADLTDAIGFTNKELEQQAKSLKGATMPDGTTHD